MEPFDPADRWVTPLWLSHHWPEDYDRCIRVGRTHVCRRCAVLYPVAFAVVVLASVLGASAEVTGAAGAVALVVLPLPAVVEFVLEHLRVIAHSPKRLIVVTVPLGVGLGVGFARYLEDLTDPLFWSVAVVYTAICLASAVWGWRQAD